MKLKTRNTNLAQIVIVKSDVDDKKTSDNDQPEPNKEPEQEKQEDKS